MFSGVPDNRRIQSYIKRFMRNHESLFIYALEKAQYKFRKVQRSTQKSQISNKSEKTLIARKEKEMKANSEELRNLLPMNLQLFASDEPADDTGNDGNNQGAGDDGAGDDGGNKNDDPGDGTPTIEDLMTELAKERAEKAKMKNSLDEAASEAAKYKKQLREKQSAKEIEDEEKKKAQEEHNKYVAELEAFKKKAEAKARYALQGMSEELATKAAEAEVKGDMDELASIQRKHTETLLKQKEKEWIKSRPDINVGGGDDEIAQLEKQVESIMFQNNGLISYT